MNKENLEKAKEIFAAHSSKNTLHFTSDGLPFFLKNDAENHARGLEDKTLTVIERSDIKVAKEAPAATTDAASKKPAGKAAKKAGKNAGKADDQHQEDQDEQEGDADQDNEGDEHQDEQ